MSHATEGDFHAYLDGALAAYDPEAAERLVSHLGRCADCRARLEAERTVRDRAGELLGVALPAVEVPAFESVAGAAGRPGRGGRRLSVERFAWAAGILVALGAGWMGNALLRSEPGLRLDTVASTPMADDAAGAPGEELAARIRPETPATEGQVAAVSPGDVAGPAESGADDRVGSGAVGTAEQDANASRDRLSTAPTDVVAKAARADLADPATVEGVESLQAVRQAAQERVLDAPAVTAPARELVDESAGRFGDEAGWVEVDEETATLSLGRPPLRHPDLPVVRIDVSDTPGSAHVRVVQRLPDGELLEVLQQRLPVGQALDEDLKGEPAPAVEEAEEPQTLDFRARRAGARLSEIRNQVDDIVVVLRARLASDSLAVLVSRIR